jgi:hypothetical protein
MMAHGHPSPVELWTGERDPGRAPLDAAEIAQRIPFCTVQADTVQTDSDAGQRLLIPA